MSKPVLAVGWDVGGWCGSKQGVAAATLTDGTVQWLGSPKSLRLWTEPIDSFQQLVAAATGCTVNPADYTVFLAVDAPLGFPAPFREFLNGKAVPPFAPNRGIENPLAYRFTDREIHRVWKKTPMSGSFDKLGNNATVAMWHLRKWKAAGAVDVLPFDDLRVDTATAIEVYPALAKLGSEEKGRAVERFDKHLRHVRPDSDEYDAGICAVMALAFAESGSMPALLPPMVGPPDDADVSLVTAEGWIYYPDPEWLATRSEAHV